MAGLKVAKTAGHWRQIAAETKACADAAKKRALFLDGELLRIQEERTGLQDRIQLLEIQNRDLMGVIAVAHQREMLWESATHLIVEARPRYWEDSAFDEVYDHEDGLLVPLRRGDKWCPVIELKTGRVLNWHSGLRAKIHYKVCDQGFYFLGNSQGTRSFQLNRNYVPKLLCIGEDGWGDYVIMTIGPDGLIKGWQRPFLDPADWIAPWAPENTDPAHVEFRQWLAGFATIPRKTYRNHAKHSTRDGYGRWDMICTQSERDGKTPSLLPTSATQVDLKCEDDLIVRLGVGFLSYFDRWVSENHQIFLRPCLPDGTPCPWQTEDK